MNFSEKTGSRKAARKEESFIRNPGLFHGPSKL